MRVEYWEYDDVAEDGTCASGGKVDTKPRIRIERGSRATEGILVEGMGVVRSKSDVENPLWVMMTDGRKSNGILRGMTAFFDSAQEMERWLAEGIAG